eukprot:TRINITY_DN2083_c0_g1_i2.p2 TRINITY_DN2083_c0_g1~~TRINITY_DN2083_c0_g1_i2.p2  ORF type:complete len:1829 (-),score=411.06 TRINITY_DN2083_c0_g1_i2:5659-11145(-)
MGQSQSATKKPDGDSGAAAAAEPILDGEEMLFELFNNTTLVNYLNKNSKLEATPSDKDEDSTATPLSSEERRGCGGGNNSSLKWEAGRWVWWRDLQQPGQVQNWSPLTVNPRLGSFMSHIGEQSGSTQRLLRDSAIQRRATFLNTLYGEMHSKTAAVQKRDFLALDVALLFQSSSTPLSPGLSTGLSTGVKIVLALLKQNTKSNPEFCNIIIDILFDSLKTLEPLSLSESEVSTTAEGKSYFPIFKDSMALVSDFLIESIKNPVEGMDQAARNAFRTKSLEALIGLSLGSSSLSANLVIIDLLLKVSSEVDAEGKPVIPSLKVGHWLSKLEDSRSKLAGLWDTTLPEQDDKLEEMRKIANTTDEPIPTYQVMLVLLHNLSVLVTILVNSLIADAEKLKRLAARSDEASAIEDRIILLSFPFVVDVCPSTFAALYTIIELCVSKVGESMAGESEKGKEKGLSAEEEQLYKYLLLTGLKLLKVNLRQLDRNRIKPENVGLEWPEQDKEKSLPSKLGSLLRAFINDPKAIDTFGPEVGNEACEGLAVALDYFVPSQIDQAELFLNACQEKADSGKALSRARAVFLEQLLVQYSGPAVFEHLLNTLADEKEKPVPKEFFNRLLQLLVEISKQEFSEMVTTQFLEPGDEPQGPPATRPGYVRFFLALQNSAFCALSVERSSAENNDAKSEEETKLYNMRVDRLQRYVILSLQHFNELLEIAGSVVDKWVAKNKEAVSEDTDDAGKLERKKIETRVLANAIAWLSRASVLSLIPPMMSSLLFVDPFEIEQPAKKKTSPTAQVTAVAEETKPTESTEEAQKGDAPVEKKKEEGAAASTDTVKQDEQKPAEAKSEEATSVATAPVAKDKGKEKVEEVEEDKQKELAEFAAKQSKQREQKNNMLLGVREVLRLVGKLHSLLLGQGYTTLFGKDFSQKLVTVVETLHPYQNDTDIEIQVIHPDAETMTLEWDSQCATEETHDYMHVYLDTERTKQIGEKFTGPAGRFPCEPVLIPASSCQLFFHSDVSNVDWGIKCTLTSEVTVRSWISELERTLLWINAQSAVDLLGSIDKREKSFVPWLNSNLFRLGRESSTATVAPSATMSTESSFLEDLIEKRNEASKLDSKMTPNNLSVSASHLAMISSPELDKAVRAVVAALLKHTELTPMAMRNADTNKARMPAQIKKAYRYAFRIKKALITQRQQSGGSKTYAELAAPIIEKARLLLEFMPMCSATPKATNPSDIVTPASLRRSIGQIIAEEKPGSTAISAFAEDDEDHKWDGPDAIVWPWEAAAKAILAFVQTDLKIDDFNSIIDLRKQRATQRTEGLVMLRNLLQVAPPTLLPDALGFTGLALKGYSLAGRYLPDFHNKKKKVGPRPKMPTTLQHYSQDIFGCSNELQTSLAESVFPLYKDIMALFSSEHTHTAIETNICLLEALAVRFQSEADFQFLKLADIFKWLEPMLFADVWANAVRPAKKDKEDSKQDEEESMSIDELLAGLDSTPSESTTDKSIDDLLNSLTDTPSEPTTSTEQQIQPSTVEESTKTMPALVADVTVTQEPKVEQTQRPRSDSELAREIQARMETGNEDVSDLFGETSTTATTTTTTTVTVSEGEPEVPSTTEEPQQEEEDEDAQDIFGLFGDFDDDMFGTSAPERPRSDNNNRAKKKPKKRAVQGLVRKRQWLVPDSQQSDIPSDPDAGDPLGSISSDNDVSIFDEPDEDEVVNQTRLLLRRQRRAAWDLYQFLALQCLVPASGAKKEQTKQEDSSASESQTSEPQLLDVQKALVVDFLEILRPVLSKPLAYKPGICEKSKDDDDEDEDDLVITHTDVVTFFEHGRVVECC